MIKNKLPKFESDEALAEYLDEHDMAEHFDEMTEVEFEIDIKRHRYLIEVQESLMKQILKIAKVRHITSEQLINEWLVEKTASRPTALDNKHSRQNPLVGSLHNLGSIPAHLNDLMNGQRH